MKLRDQLNLLSVAPQQGRVTRDPIAALHDLSKSLESLDFFDLHKTALELSAVLVKQPVMILLAKEDGNIEFMNPFGAHHLGYTREEMIGKSYKDFVFQDDKAKTQTAHDGMSKEPLHKGFTNRWTTKEGGTRSLLWFCSPWIGSYALCVAIPVDMCGETTCPLRDYGSK